AERLCRALPCRAQIIRGRATSCCSLGIRTSAATGLFNVASGWAACCVIIIRRRRNGAPANERTDGNKKGKPKAHKGSEAGATYAGPYTGGGGVAASIYAPRNTRPRPAIVPVMCRGWMANSGNRLAVARTRLPQAAPVFASVIGNSQEQK